MILFSLLLSKFSIFISVEISKLRESFLIEPSPEPTISSSSFFKNWAISSKSLKRKLYLNSKSSFTICGIISSDNLIDKLSVPSSIGFSSSSLFDITWEIVVPSYTKISIAF